jgi:hypothetical protein
MGTAMATVADTAERRRLERLRAETRLTKLTLLLAFSLLLAACGGQAAVGDRSDAEGSGAVAHQGAPAPAPQRRTRPAIALRRPADGQSVRGGAVTVSVAVEGFELVEQRVRPPFPPPVHGKGHVHFYLDTERLPTTHSPPATGTYRSISGRTYTWTGLAPGTHSLAVQLVGKDHAPLRPPAKDRVTVDVE